MDYGEYEVRRLTLECPQVHELKQARNFPFRMQPAVHFEMDGLTGRSEVAAVVPLAHMKMAAVWKREFGLRGLAM